MKQQKYKLLMMFDNNLVCSIRMNGKQHILNTLCNIKKKFGLLDKNNFILDKSNIDNSQAGERYERRKS